MASIVKAAGVHKGKLLSSAATHEEREGKGLVHVCKSTGVDALGQGKPGSCQDARQKSVDNSKADPLPHKVFMFSGMLTTSDGHAHYLSFTCLFFFPPHST